MKLRIPLYDDDGELVGDVSVPVTLTEDNKRIGYIQLSEPVSDSKFAEKRSTFEIRWKGDE